MAGTSRGEGTRNTASCCAFLAAQIAFQFAEQGVPAFLSPVGQLGDEGFDLLTGPGEGRAE